MSVSRHHADWLIFVENSGPFVSLPVLMRVFPQGLEPRDPAQAKSLREAYAEWQDDPAAPGKQRAWVMHVLTAVLGYPLEQIAEGQTLPAGLEANMPEMGETLRPDFALVGPTRADTARQAQLLIASYPVDQALGKPVIGKHWKATPITRMMELLHGAGVPLGLITNGEEWMLVYAPRGETTGYASWYGALWLDEPITLRAFHSLLGVRRFFGVAADNTLLTLLKESANDQQEVTDQLGYQVREAVEVLVQSLDALDKESGRTLLNGVSETALYDAALTIMMRLVFLFAAEERDLLHLGKPLYDDNYAVSTLQEQLQEVADRYGEEVLERRYDAWARLLATFRAVHGGIRHQDLLMRAYGGSLFDPDRYPFLEGRAAGSAWRSTAAEPLAVNNRVVLHLLNSLQRLRIKVGTGGMAETRRVSFRALGVEQIGHVYEGLLDHTAVRAGEAVLGIRGTRSKEAEIPLATLESLQAQGQDKLVEFLKEETGRAASALSRTLEEGSLLDEHKLLIACGQDETLLDRLRPFVGLIREDSFERPLVVLPGSIYVTVGATRRSTGTHYTPPSLTEPIVQYALEPLVYEGPAEGRPREQWKLKPPSPILDLKVCDMTMGSGAFLVQACRYLAERLVESWENAEKQHPGEVLITPDGKFSEGSPSERLVPADASERIGIARRVVADRCLYGVDINPMAVEMAKLSLWLITVDRNRPFTFLDHAFKSGDSLLGITSLEQLENFSLLPGGVKQQAFATLDLRRHIDQAKKKREALEAMPSDTPEQIAAKTALHAEAEEAVAKLNAAADLLMAIELKELRGRSYDAEREASADQIMAYWAERRSELYGYAQQRLAGRHCLHWSLAYPELMGRGGFDAFIGNPPFLGGTIATGVLGDDYMGHLARRFSIHGKSDLVSYFFRQAFDLMNPGGTACLIATKTIAQGTTCEGSLGAIVAQGGEIVRAVQNFRWPGEASVVVSVVQFMRSKSKISKVLDDIPVKFISTSLEANLDFDPSRAYVLYENEGTSFKGSAIIGIGFVITPAEKKELLSKQPKNHDVIKKFLTGDDLNSRSDASPSRWIISFRGRSLEEAKAFKDCLKIVCDRVKPARDRANRDAHRLRWWQYGDWRPGLYRTISKYPRVIAIALTTKYLVPQIVPASYEFDQSVIVIASEDPSLYATLLSDIHCAWAWGSTTSLGGTYRYNPTSCFQTYPFARLAPGSPENNCLARLGRTHQEIRMQFIGRGAEGLTQIYNRFHNSIETAADLTELRKLHVEINNAVAAAYGWQDLDLGCGFHVTKQGIRFTICEAARREVLDRLLALNHQRHAEEEAELRAQPTRVIAKRGRKKQDARDQILIEL